MLAIHVVPSLPHFLMLVSLVYMILVQASAVSSPSGGHSPHLIRRLPKFAVDENDKQAPYDVAKQIDKQANGAVATNSMYHFVCNMSMSSYNDDKCFELVVGRTLAQHHAVLSGLESRAHALGGSGDYAPTTERGTCAHRFFLPSFRSFEEQFPKFANCHISTYASIVQEEALKHPCSTAKASEGDFLMVPPYSALECNWPSYGGGNCLSTANTFRNGELCFDGLVDAAIQLRETNGGKRVLLIDTNSLWTPYNLPKESYTREGLIWAKGNALSEFYRQHVDISMPPPATPICSKTPASAYEEPVNEKRFFMSFKGNMDPTHSQYDERRNIQRLFNNAKDQIIAASQDHEYDFQDLLYGSRFNLILRGDVEFSYRFNEAVCSGGVPVLVTDNWIPPFNEFLPFDSYGVLVKESDVATLLSTLKALSDENVQKLRDNANTYCQKAFQSTSASVSSLLSFLTAQDNRN